MKLTFLRVSRFFLSLSFLCILSSVEAQSGAKGNLKYALPVDGPVTLAGSYAELRANHFHGGWDFRTGGKENQPIYAAADGYVSHVVISPAGYGKMAIVAHPDGTSTIYGHLNGFVGELDSTVRKEQYRQKRYDVSLSFQPSQFPVKVGQHFAISGNTGGSAGPHLHFEIRRTSDLLMMNPYLHNDVFGIKDDKKPTLFGIKLSAVPQQGAVAGLAEKKFACNAGKATTLRSGASIKAWGKLNVAVKANDKMNDTWFKYGIRDYKLYFCDTLISQVHISDFLFDDKRGINSLIDFKQMAKTKEFFVKFSKEPGNPLKMHSHLKNNGVITINQEGKEYPVRIVLEDDFANRDTFDFKLVGQKQGFASPDSNVTCVLKQGKLNSFSRPNILINFPPDVLYTDVPLKFSCDTLKKFFTPAYDFDTEFVPLHANYDFALRLENDTLKDKSKYVVVRLNEKNLITGHIKAKYFNGYMMGQSNYLSRMSVYFDSTPPVITPLNVQNLRKNPVMTLRIKDNLAGIESYNAYIDGKWVLMEFDMKTARLICDLRKVSIAQNTSHSLKVEVADACGNVGVYETKIYF